MLTPKIFCMYRHRYVFICIFSIEIKRALRWISLFLSLLFLSKNIDRVRMQTILGINFYANFFHWKSKKWRSRRFYIDLSRGKFSFIISSALVGGSLDLRRQLTMDIQEWLPQSSRLLTVRKVNTRRGETMVESDERRTRSRSSKRESPPLVVLLFKSAT